MAQTPHDELSEEDLMDDLITLVGNDVEPGIEIAIIEDDDDCIQIVSSTQDDSSLQDEVSWYGKRSVVPVTFFNNARNIRLLSKCQPMSVQVVDCDKCPWYYEERTQKPGPKKRQLIKLVKDTDNADSYKIVQSFTDQNTKTMDTLPDRTDTADVLSDDDVIYIPTSKNNSVGESCKSETEAISRKQTHMSKTEMNFKKNTGLIGMKVSLMFEDSTKDTNKNEKIQKDQKTKSNTKEADSSGEKHPKLNSVVEVAENQMENSTMDPKAVKNKLRGNTKPDRSNAKNISKQTVKKPIYLDSLRGRQPLKKKPTDIRSKIKNQRKFFYAPMMKTSDDGKISPILPCSILSKKNIKESLPTLNSHLVLDKRSENNSSSEEATKRESKTDSSDQAVDSIQTSLLEQLMATMTKPPPLPASKERSKASVIVKHTTPLPLSMPILEETTKPTSSQVPNETKYQIEIVSSHKLPTEERTVSKKTWDSDLRIGTPTKKKVNKPFATGTENNNKSSLQKKGSAETTTKPSKCIVLSKASIQTELNKPEPQKVVPMFNNQNKTATIISDTTQINMPTAGKYQKATAVKTSEVPKTKPKVNDRRNIETVNPKESQKMTFTTINYQGATLIQNFGAPKIMPSKVNDKQNYVTRNFEMSQNVTSTTANHQGVTAINNSETQKSNSMVNDQTNSQSIIHETAQKLIPTVQQQGKLKVRPLSELSSKPLPPSFEPQRMSTVPPQWAGYSSAKPVQNMNNMVAVIENPPANKYHHPAKDQWEQMYSEFCKRNAKEQNQRRQYHQNVNIEKTSLHSTAQQLDWLPQWQRTDAALQNLLQLYSRNSNDHPHHQNSKDTRPEQSANQHAPPAPIYYQANDGVSPYHNYTENPSSLNENCCVPPPPPPPSYHRQHTNFHNQVSQAQNVNVPPMINYDQVHMNPSQIPQTIHKTSQNNDKQSRITSLLDTYLTAPRDSMHPMFSYTQPPPPPPPPPPLLQPAKEDPLISTPENPDPVVQLNNHMTSPHQNVFRKQQPKPAVSAKDGVRMNLINIPLTVLENGNALTSVPSKERLLPKRRLSFNVHETELLKVLMNDEEPNTKTETKSTRVNHSYASAVQLSDQPKTNISLRRRLSVDANCMLTTPYSRTSSSINLPKPDQQKQLKGYSPPILPIPTVERSLRLLSAAQAQEQKDELDNSRTPKRHENKLVKPGPQSLNVKPSVNYKRCPEKRKSIDELNEEVRKKITLNDYLNRLNTEGKINDVTRVVDLSKRNEVNVEKDRKIKRKRSNSGNLSDLGYDSDSTVKL